MPTPAELQAQYAQIYAKLLAAKDAGKVNAEADSPTMVEPDAPTRGIDLAQVAKAYIDKPTGAVSWIPTAAKAIASGLYDKGAEALSALNPTTDANFKDRAYHLTNAATLGLADQLVDKYAKTGEQTGQGSVTKAAGSLLYDFTPIENVFKGMSGRDENGNPLTSEQLSMNAVDGILKALPALKGVAMAKNALTEGVVAPAMREVITKNQFKTAAATLGKEDLVKPVAEDIANTILNPEQNAAAVNRLQGSNALMKKLIDPVASNPDRQNLVGSVLKTIQEGIDDGTFRPEHMVQIAKDYGISVDDVADHLIQDFGAIRKSGSAAGRIMYDLSRLNRTGVARRVLDITKDLTMDPARREALEAMSAASRPVTIYNNLTDIYRDKWLNLERGLAVTQLQTALRNFKVQGIVGAADLGEQLMADTILAGVKLPGQIKEAFKSKSLDAFDFSNAFAGVRGQWAGLVHTMTPKGRAKLAEVLDELPYEKGKLFGSPVTGDVIARSVLDKEAEGMAQRGFADKTIDILNTPNTLQERELRRLFFSGRLLGNVKRLGFDNLDDILPALQSGKRLAPELTQAITDATDHALKQTFAFAPGRDTFGGTVLNMYKQMPYLADLAHLFPRFLVNQYRYIWERNPMHAMEAFAPEFRDQLLRASGGELTQAAAARTLAKAVSGMTTLAAAQAVRSLPGAENLKYYQIPIADGKVMDIRGDQPFAQALFTADVLKAWSQGKSTPDNLNSNELADAIAGVRNLSSVPLFATDNILRQVDSSDPESFGNALQKLGGQKLGILLTPLRTVLDVGAATGLDKKLGYDFSTQKDTSSDLITGPMLASVPGARDILPDRPNAFAEGPAKTDNPGLKQLGVSIDNITPMENLVSRLGISTTEMVGQYDNPEANRLVQQKFGELLGTKASDGTTLADTLANTLDNLKDPNGAPYPKPVMIDILRMGILPDIRQRAVEAAKAELPGAFLENEVNNQHSAILKDIFVKDRAARTAPTKAPYDPLKLLQPRQ